LDFYVNLKIVDLYCLHCVFLSVIDFVTFGIYNFVDRSHVGYLS